LSTSPKSKSTRPLLLKVLKAGGIPPLVGSDFRWSLPTQADDGSWAPGAWMEISGRLKACSNGLHLCRVQDLPNWIRYADEIYLAEHDGRMVVHDDETSQSKVVVRKARLVSRVAFSDRVLREWAADCAEHSLPIFEQRYPDDKRPRQAIEAARAYMRGEISLEALQAARNEARKAADADAYAADAADADAYAADATVYAAYAAYAYADAAAYAAYAAYAADAAARKQERAWQARRLAELLGLSAGPAETTAETGGARGEGV
jgi:hypothetical protein